MKKIHKQVIRQQAQYLRNLTKECFTAKQTFYQNKPMFTMAEVRALRDHQGPNYKPQELRSRVKSLTDYQAAALFRSLDKNEVIDASGNYSGYFYDFKCHLCEKLIGSIKLDPYIST